MNTFTIRPMINEGESLTSYILRLCNSNGIEIKDLLNNLYTKFEATDVRNGHQVDINPINTIDVTFLTDTAKLNNEYLYENTFFGLISKFSSSEEMDSVNNSSTLIKSLFTTRKRRFCPACLQESIMYKLIWQVSDILTCSVHNSPLTSVCAKCGQEQPYLHMKLSIAKCKYCENSLTTLQKIHFENESIAYSNWLKNQWEYLNSLSIPDLKNDKEIAKRIFYIAGDKKEYFCINNISHISRDYIYKLIGILSNKPSEKYGIGLNILFRLLWELNFSMKDFLNLSVPETFLDSIDVHLHKRSFVKCLTPWCISKGSSEKLVRIKSLRSKTHNCLYLCLGCCIKYGMHKENSNWEEYGDIISKGYQIILPMINRGENKLQISKKTGISRYKIYKLSSYLARFNLIRDSYIHNYTPGNNTLISKNDLIEYANINETKMRTVVQKKLNIRLCDFYYFYYDSDFQEYLYRS